MRRLIPYLFVFLALAIAGGAPDAFAHKTKNAQCFDEAPDTSSYHTKECGKQLGTVQIVRPHKHEELEDDDGNPSGVWKTVYGVEGVQVQFGGTVCAMRDYAIVATVASCFKSVFSAVGKSTITSIVNYFGVYAASIAGLAIMFFGFRVVFGGQSIKPEFMMMVFKLAIIFAFAGNAALIIKWYGWAMDAPVELSSVVSNAVLDPTEGVYGNIDPDWLEKIRERNPARADKIRDRMEKQFNVVVSCDENYRAGNTAKGEVFYRLDCLIHHTLGAYGDLGGFIGAASVMIGSFWMGGLGSLLAFVILASHILLFIAAFQAVIIYLMALIALTFLSALVPIILPMWLFGHRGMQRMVGQWAQFILAYIIQPFIMFTFLSVMLVAMSFIAREIKELHEDAYQVSQGAMGNTTSQLFNLDKTKIGVDQVEKFVEAIKERALVGTEAPIVGDTGYFNFRSIDGGAGAKAVPDNNGGITEHLELKIETNILDWSSEKRRHYLTLHVANILLLWVLYSFMRRLPTISGEMIGRIRPPSISTRLSEAPSRLYDQAKQKVGKRN